MSLCRIVLSVRGIFLPCFFASQGDCIDREWLLRGCQRYFLFQQLLPLLHYFFLPKFLLHHASQLLSTVPSPLLPVIIFLAALVVVPLCLATSYVLRLSPFLARYLLLQSSVISSVLANKFMLKYLVILPKTTIFAKL